MCGIAGIVSSGADISGALVNSIKSLEYRGYDSCGVAIINGSSAPEIRKNIGDVDHVRDRENFSELSGHVGIAHTRWATHGGVTRENAHPHSSCDGHFTLSHNGIITNYTQLRDKLKKKGHTFVSETDTEVIVHLVEEFYKSGGPVERAFTSALGALEGTYAICLITTIEPDRIYCARKESPLIIGLGSDANYIGSDFNAFIAHTKSAVIMEDYEYAIITHDGYSLKTLPDGEVVSRNVSQIEWDPEMAQKGGFPHYMLKEIFEQPQVVINALDISAPAITSLAKVIASKDKCYLTGVGTTFYVAQLGQYYFSKYAGLTPNLVSSDEFRFMAQPDPDSITLAASQSGETYDTLTALKFSKERGAVTAAIVNVMGSSMSRLVDHLILQGSGPEISVISTKAALAQMIILARLSLELGIIGGKITKRQKTKYENQLRLLPGVIETIVNEKSGFVHNIAKEQSHIAHWLFLGRGCYYPIARESALKMKEVAYVHAEGMPSGFLKHGTMALIDNNLNSVVFMPPSEEKELYRLTISSAEEIKARDGYLLGLTFGDKIVKDLPFTDQIVLPKTPGIIAPFVELVTAQLLSYYTATTLKRNIDRPRALAKSVTVA